MTENNGSATSYGYDFAGRLLSENRTGTNPYASTYSYTNRGQRATAFRSENGVASHNGTYTYDDAGRLTTVADTVTASGLGGNYTWNADSTLASYPGPGYTRKLSYDEEGRLTKIDRDNGTTITPVFEYGYGFDGNRRWRKDLAGNTWDWYPCGVACCAGELVTMRSTNGGASWSSNSLRLSGSNVFEGSPFLGSITSGATKWGSEQIVSDGFGVLRSGSFANGLNTILNPLRNDEASDQIMAMLQLSPRQKIKPIEKEKPKPIDMAKCRRDYNKCAYDCSLAATACVTGAYTAFLATAAGCWLIPNPIWRKRCLALASTAWGTATALCYAQQETCLKGCQYIFEDCINGK